MTNRLESVVFLRSVQIKLAITSAKWMVNLVSDTIIEIRDDGQLVAAEVYSLSGILLTLSFPDDRSYNRQADNTWLSNDSQRLKELHTDGPEDTGFSYAVYCVAGW